MTSTVTALNFKLPYPLRHLLPEIKKRGGRFNPDDKTWDLADTEENKAFVSRITVPAPKPLATPEERIRTVATVAVELLNGLKVGRFVLVETTVSRVVIEKVQSS